MAIAMLNNDNCLITKSNTYLNRKSAKNFPEYQIYRTNAIVFETQKLRKPSYSSPSHRHRDHPLITSKLSQHTETPLYLLSILPEGKTTKKV